MDLFDPTPAEKEFDFMETLHAFKNAYCENLLNLHDLHLTRAQQNAIFENIIYPSLPGYDEYREIVEKAEEDRTIDELQFVLSFARAGEQIYIKFQTKFAEYVAATLRAQIAGVDDESVNAAVRGVMEED